MGRDYAGLILENTDKGLVLSQIECKKADKGEAEQVNSSVGLTQNTVYLKVRFSCDGKKIKASEGGNDLIVICNFSYSLDGKKFLPLGNPFQEGRDNGLAPKSACSVPVRLLLPIWRMDRCRLVPNYKEMIRFLFLSL